MYLLGRPQVKEEMGRVFGIGLEVRKGCSKMSLRDGLSSGLVTRIFLMRSLALSEMGTESGKL